ncbi:hypothetical protein [Amycolatopsis sp. CA-230715]|uniref:hypothetical protein n=1 Tax=Amycolatopsis sp. CA-230715 TaxID=2745196 RepID=UPI001C02258E|nr:hypothetical protein [Amycolatopsis sp. CA-230715]QWF78713.1 hypothetical protein HUW46_02111 [Amycolatopsis sp. CA-230715]
MNVAILTVAVVLLVVSVVWHVVEEYRGRTIAARRRVVVCLVDDQAITGILWRRHRRLLVVRSAELVQPGREAVGMDGDVVIERDRINWVQIVGAG